jgi:hypothetical protein
VHIGGAVHRKADDVRLEHPAVETCTVEQSGEKLLGGTHRVIDAARQFLNFRVRPRLRLEGRYEQSRGIERLEQIVAGSGEETRLARIRGFGLLFGKPLRFE